MAITDSQTMVEVTDEDGRDLTYWKARATAAEALLICAERGARISYDVYREQYEDTLPQTR